MAHWKSDSYDPPCRLSGRRYRPTQNASTRCVGVVTTVCAGTLAKRLLGPISPPTRSPLLPIAKCIDAMLTPMTLRAAYLVAATARRKTHRRDAGSLDPSRHLRGRRCCPSQNASTRCVSVITTVCDGASESDSHDPPCRLSGRRYRPTQNASTRCVGVVTTVCAGTLAKRLLGPISPPTRSPLLPIAKCIDAMLTPMTLRAAYLVAATARRKRHRRDAGSLDPSRHLRGRRCCPSQNASTRCVSVITTVCDGASESDSHDPPCRLSGRRYRPTQNASTRCVGVATTVCAGTLAKRLLGPISPPTRSPLLPNAKRIDTEPQCHHTSVMAPFPSTSNGPSNMYRVTTAARRRIPRGGWDGGTTLFPPKRDTM
ncbi:hypothetical protein C8R47DRAFT_1077584 [Mycena vitilis]|nr:hypothetical protein C8R47DRAFT_1077584 [Mycena vitilis]